jgi:hypothetical protein
MFHLVEQAKWVNINSPADKTGAAVTTEWVSVKNASQAWFVIKTGTMTSTSNQAVTLYVADDASGTHNKAITSASAAATLTMPYYYKIGATGAAVKTTVSSSTFNLTKSSDNNYFIIPVNVSQMGTLIQSSVTYNADYVRVNVATPGAHACLMSVDCILTGLRYAEDVPPSAIT